MPLEVRDHARLAELPEPFDYLSEDLLGLGSGFTGTEHGVPGSEPGEQLVGEWIH